MVICTGRWPGNRRRRGGRAAVVLGLYCRDDLLAREIEETVLSLRMGAGCGEKPVRGMDYELRRLASLLTWGPLLCVIVSW